MTTLCSLDKASPLDHLADAESEAEDPAQESRGVNRRFPQRPWDSTAFYVGQVFVFQ